MHCLPSERHHTPRPDLHHLSCCLGGKSGTDPISVGEDVMVLLPEDSAGIMAQWHGPYTVLEKPSPITSIVC